ncbi:MAG: DUF885 domain-containing protein [Candidatus Marinimicrobia bacterium]|nr:DUF885 domain-containing protein [Candidatus Neomarinimicrobiota bacterium]MCF7830118.1 DUF885 domain-containing protein [Candidatus Neomarinimicrobiota bacterium]MCF7882487.1 DUF885 domain-containing protein [Candidatus Neomarinimicrobiota bacterium]
MQFERSIGRQLILWLVATLLLWGCGASDNQEFTSVTDNYFRQWASQHPVEAGQVGFREYDHRLPDLTQTGQEDRKELYLSTLDDLDGIDPADLSTQNRIDYYILNKALRYQVFRLDTLKVFSWDPTQYTETVTSALIDFASDPVVPDSQRAKALIRRLQNLGGWLGQVIGQLENPTPEHTEVAIRQAREIADYLSNGAFLPLFESLDQPTRTSLENWASNGSNVLNKFAGQLESQVLPNASRQVRLGGSYYAQKFRYLISSEVQPEQILTQAEEQVTALRDTLFLAAAGLAEEWWSIRYRNPNRGQKTRLIQRVMNRIRESHSAEDEIVQYLNSQLGPMEEFVRQHKLISLAHEVSLRARSDVLLLQGNTVARLHNPGLLEQEYLAEILFRAIPTDWSAKQVQEFLEEYNNFALQLVAMRYGIPGQYMQEYYARRFPSLVRSLYGGTVLRRGWGSYAEKMMVDEGWEQESPEIRVLQVQREIRDALIAVLDHRIHIQGLNRAEAIARLRTDGFITTAEANRIWRYLQMNAVTPSASFIGKEQILDTRRRYRQQYGQDYSLQEFHQQILSYGSIPLDYLRQLLLAGRI